MIPDLMNKEEGTDMTVAYKKMKNLFLRQSYLDAWEDYKRSLNKRSFIKWDYVILTASNEEQAKGYRSQIEERLEKKLLPADTHYAVLPDPDGKRVGSGGATLQVLRYLSGQEKEESKASGESSRPEDSGDSDCSGESRGPGRNLFGGKRILVIHSGGDSKRVPQYSACGKLFSPVPRELPSGRPSTLFDEFIIAMSGVPARIPEGMLVLSGDVLLLFNPLQIDFSTEGAAAISIKEPVSTGKDHGVFLNDGHDYVGRFLHKQPEEQLRAAGAVNSQNCVDLDTGAIILSAPILNELFSLISTDNRIDEEKYARFVNETARLSFYGDFLYPLAKDATLEQYYKEAAEGRICEELIRCRKEIWERLHGYSMKLLCLSPAEFIHFGTTRELTEMVTAGIDNYEFLGWKRLVLTNLSDAPGCAVHNSLVEPETVLGERVYLEDCILKGRCRVEDGSVLSGVTLENCMIPENVVLHGLYLKNGRFVVRIYGVADNPKGELSKKASFLTTDLKQFLISNHLEEADLWDDTQERCLWFANLYPVCDTMAEAADWAWRLYRMAAGWASREEIAQWKERERMSLYGSFNQADIGAILPWKQKLENHIRVRRFIEEIKKGVYYEDAFRVFGEAGLNEKQYRLLLETAKREELSLSIRIYYALSRELKREGRCICRDTYDVTESLCFDSIARSIYESAAARIRNLNDIRIVRDAVDIRLPVRVNWGGGWSDTPPHCNERGGTVLNAAISLRGRLPVHVAAKRLDEPVIRFESADVGITGQAKKSSEIQDCHNPYDYFALHKAALIACGIVPIQGECDLTALLEEMGGGIYLSTEVEGVPRGSGLGTSSILAGACVKALYALLGLELSEDELYHTVLCMEQIMSTGGGWQDQVGGLTPGVKLITSAPGIDQKLKVDYLSISEETRQELNERFTLIYSGQRRLARNLLRDVVGGYIGGRPESLTALSEMQRTAVLMRYELERGNVDGFGELLNRHWELSLMLDEGSSNTCIDQIFMACEDLIDARFIAGAGGGGFLQVLLKKGRSKEELRKRLREVFQDSGVDVWECEIVQGDGRF